MAEMSALDPRQDPFVRFQSVSKSYDGRVKVVDDLDLDIREGEFLTLLGPSGSGKTTCLMMLAGFEDATSGDILVADQAVNRLPAYKRNIGVVFQNYALFPHMTIAENLAFPLKQRKATLPDIKRRVDAALAMVELDKLASRYPRQLSGGQQQRVALARALVFEPRLVLMDEPLGALDRRLREHMQIEIKQIHGRIGMTTVYVTHDQSEALTMSDRIAVFNRGRIEQIGTPSEIYERPATPFVARFVGENNSLPARVASVQGGNCKALLPDGTEIVANMVDAMSEGDEADIAIRPERFVINPPATMQNSAQVLVTDVIYNGDHVLLPCRLGNIRLLLRSPAPHFETAPAAKGEMLKVGWETLAARAFRKEAA